LQGCDILTKLNGATFDELPTVDKLKVKRTPIRATIINKSGDSFVKYEMFKRLNTGGSLLSAQEIRNCSSRMVENGDAFYNVLQSLAEYHSFKLATSRLPDTQTEQRADEELVLRFFAVTRSRETYKGNIEEWLNGFMEGVLFGRFAFDTEALSAHFKKCFDLIYEKLGDSAFTRFNQHNEPTGRLAPAYYEAVCAVFAAHLDALAKISPNVMIDRLVQTFASDDFKAATGPGANTIPKLHKRIEVAQSFLVG